MANAQAAPVDDLDRCRRWIQHGIDIEMSRIPSRKMYKNTPTVQRNAGICKERIRYYHDMGFIQQHDDDTDTVNPLHVVLKPGKKPRVVLDLSRNLNDDITKHPFTYQSIDQAVALATPGCYFGKHDLSDCFLSFPMHPDSSRLLSFKFEDQLYRFTRMPFGLSPAPWVCERLMAVVDFELRRRGVVHVRYVDDHIYIGASASQVSSMMAAAEVVFAEFGLRVQTSKAVTPTQSIDLLGVGIDSVRQVLFVTEERQSELASLLHRHLRSRRARVRELLSLVGKLSFAAQVLPGARPFLRQMIDLTRHAKNPWSFVTISASARADFKLWLDFLSTWNGQERWQSAHTDPVTLVHDASGGGFGFWLESLPDDFDESTLPPLLRRGVGRPRPPSQSVHPVG